MFRLDGRNFCNYMKIYPAFSLRIFKGVYGNGSKTAVQGDPAQSVCERFSTASNFC